MEKTWVKNGGTKNVTIDYSSSTLTAQTDGNGFMITVTNIETLSDH